MATGEVKEGCRLILSDNNQISVLLNNALLQQQQRRHESTKQTSLISCLLVSVLPDAVEADVDDVGVVVAGDGHAGRSLQLAAMAVDDRVEAAVGVEHLLDIRMRINRNRICRLRKGL